MRSAKGSPLSAHIPLPTRDAERVREEIEVRALQSQETKRRIVPVRPRCANRSVLSVPQPEPGSDPTTVNLKDLLIDAAIQRPSINTSSAAKTNT